MHEEKQAKNKMEQKLTRKKKDKMNLPLLNFWQNEM